MHKTSKTLNSKLATAEHPSD